MAEQEATDRTGRETTIGRIDVDWTSRDHMLTGDRVEAVVTLWDVISGYYSFPEVLLAASDLALERQGEERVILLSTMLVMRSASPA